MNKFPSDFQHGLTGFGGDASKKQADHRTAIRKTPVILVHGNATNSADPKYGMLTMKGFLNSIGYNDCEIWAMDYLGENNTNHLMPHPHRDRIDVVRTFIDKVKDYLGVQKLDFIAHSLGCGMVNGYLRGLKSNGEWNNDNHRFNTVSTIVCLAGAIHGLGRFGPDEFQTGGPFEVASHRFGNAVDDTPFGEDEASKQTAPAGHADWTGVTPLDNDSVVHVAVIAQGDFVDAQNPGTGHMQGADANLVFNLGPSTLGHEKVVKDSTVFDAFKAYLNRTPPLPPASITVDKESGSYGTGLSVIVTVTPANVTASYTAKRITKSMQGGFLSDVVAQTSNGTISNGQSLGFDTDGEWELTLSASGAETVERTYGVNVILPEASILTDNSVPFQRQLDVSASTTKGALYHSLDRQRWNAGAIVTITQTSKVYFIAIAPDGLASPIVSRSFEMKAVEQVSATLTEHYIAHRISLDQYLKLGQQVGFTASVTLYFINNQWVLDPNTPEISHEAPLVHLSADAGTHAAPLALALSAHHKTDAAPAIYYTLDGSVPTESSPSFNSSGVIRFDTAGARTLRYRARDACGNWSDVETRTFTLNIQNERPAIECDKASGAYAEGFDAMLTASDNADPQITVYYTQDGSDPSDVHNPNRQSFIGSKTFSFKTPGRHAIFCYAKNSAGKEIMQPFAWDIDDRKHPETSLSPAMGGRYIGSVTVKLSPSEKCEWTKYTTDGSEPSDTHGIMYAGPITVTESTALKFRSKDTQGNLEPVRTAAFSITHQPEKIAFSSQADRNGHVKANPDGSGAFVGTARHLAVGSSWDNKDSRAILHFDTSSLPDNAVIDRAYLEVSLHCASGDVWADGRKLEVDVQRGTLGSLRTVETGDWGAAATAEGAASIDRFTSGSARSSDFLPAGLQAINKTGITQVRIKAGRPLDAPDNCIYLRGGAGVRLVVGYSAAGV